LFSPAWPMVLFCKPRKIHSVTELSLDRAISFPSRYFPEVHDLLSEFSDLYQPIEGLDLWNAFPKDWPLPKKLYEDCFLYPKKNFYWRFEQEAPDPKTKAGQNVSVMNRILLEKLAKMFDVEISGNSVMGWKPQRSKFKHVE